MIYQVCIFFYSWRESQQTEDKILPYDIKIKALDNLSMIQNNGLNYSVAGIKIILDRNSRNLIMTNYFLPIGLFAALSIISFVIKPEIVILIFTNLNVKGQLKVLLYLGAWKNGNAGDNIANHNYCVQRNRGTKIPWI